MRIILSYNTNKNDSYLDQMTARAQYYYCCGYSR